MDFSNILYAHPGIPNGQAKSLAMASGLTELLAKGSHEELWANILVAVDWLTWRLVLSCYLEVRAALFVRVLRHLLTRRA